MTCASLISDKHCLIDTSIDTYFRNFHESLPLLEQDKLRMGFENTVYVTDAHSATLLLSVFLVTHLCSTPATGNGDGDEVYHFVKSMFFLLQGQALTVELLQIGLLLVTWEHSQALHQDAWLSIGTCVRIGNVLGLHRCVRRLNHEDGSEKGDWDRMRSLWWCIVLLERYVHLLELILC